MITVNREKLHSLLDTLIDKIGCDECPYYNECKYTNNCADFYIEQLMKERELTEREKRCQGCAYLYEDGDCDWACDECGKKVNDISDDECSANLNW